MRDDDALRLTVLVVAAMLGFSGNSLLTRLALSTGAIDASSFMMVRLACGGATLAAIAGWPATRAAGSWRSAIALAVYAPAFTYSYLRVGAGAGALLLFGSVQALMIGTGLVRGERPGWIEWLGLALAIVGLLVLTAPGLTAPDARGAMLMVVAGVAWGIYSLRGQRAGSPLAATAGNFVRTVPLVLVFVLVVRDDVFVTGRGLLLAAVSGSITSGLAYVAWYAALPRLTAWRASIVQLSVPVGTALVATVLLDEMLTLRLVAAGGAIIGGVLLAVVSATRRGPSR